MYDLKILSYHKFNKKPSDYIFSRTYEQFINDLANKEYDWITIDDGSACMIQACEIMREMNIRAKLFISPDLIGKKGYGLPGTSNTNIYQEYCSWEEIKELAKYHDIENHSYEHIRLTECTNNQIMSQINSANQAIEEKTGRKPRYFVPPWNQATEKVVEIAHSLGLQTIKNRVDMKNYTP